MGWWKPERARRATAAARGVDGGEGVRSGVQGNRPVARRAPAAAQPGAAASSPVRPERCCPRPRRAGGTEPTLHPGLLPAAARWGSPRGPGVPGGGGGAAGGCWCRVGNAMCLRGPRSPGHRPAARPPTPPGSGATWLLRRGVLPSW
ncbi:translation initiation factor IF-2-like [Panthera pardus]|uniref:Translation initiation factor IF-2-like n=1 Tax=Panthera pardus TaxID=9691 RepID=A0A9W2VDM8_PANPR|nr:translation initiation factor IF-2-like [Panthera pardus]